VQVTIGLGIGASLLFGCSGGVLNVGSNDAGASSDRDAAIERASEVCALLKTDTDTWATVQRQALPYTVYAPQKLRQDLSGEWAVCTFSNAGIRSFQFTADGHWTLHFDGDGGLKGSPDGPPPLAGPGSYAGFTEADGTYTLQDSDGGGSGDGGAVFVGTSSPWFRPSFTTVMGGGRVMVMSFIGSSQDTCAFVGP
jgi:hypothetical protein